MQDINTEVVVSLRQSSPTVKTNKQNKAGVQIKLDVYKSTYYYRNVVNPSSDFFVSWFNKPILKERF